MKTPYCHFSSWLAISVVAAAVWAGFDTPSFAAAPLQAEDRPVDEMKFIDQLEQLQQQLQSPDLERRDQAEQELIKLGPFVLDYLEPPADASTDTLQRLGRVRTKLEKIAIEKFTQASKVTLQGKLKVDRALELISNQSGNRISADGLPDTILEKELQLNLKDVEFWNALYEVMNQNELMIDPYGGETGTLKIISQPIPANAGDPNAVDPNAVDPNAVDPNATETKPPSAPRCLSGMFDFSVARVVSERDFRRPRGLRGGTTQVALIARWEPRLKPISVEMPFELITILDENDEELKLLREDGVFYASASAEFPEIELLIPLELVDRKITRINRLEAVLVALMPGRQETFRFKKLGQLQEGTELRKGGAMVKFEGLIKNDDLYGITLQLSFDESFNALESHRAWAYDNPMYLEDSEGKKLEPVTIEGLRQSNSEVAIRYYFTEDPQEYKIVYKTVAAIVKQDIKIRLEKIDLP